MDDSNHLLLNHKNQRVNEQASYILAMEEAYGPFSYETLQAIQTQSSKFQEFQAKLISNLQKVKDSKTEDRHLYLSHELLMFFAEKKGLTASALRQLIQVAIKDQLQNSKIAKHWGMKEQYPDKLSLFAEKIKQTNRSFEEGQRQLKWKEVQQLIDKIAPRVNAQTYLLDKKVDIYEVEEFKYWCNKLKIPFKKIQQSLEQSFKMFQFLGAEYHQTKVLVEKLTYPAYFDRMMKLVYRIISISFQKKIQKQISELYFFVKVNNEFYAKKFFQLICDYLKNNGLIKLASPDRIKSVDQRIAKVIQEIISTSSDYLKKDVIQKIKECAFEFVQKNEKDSMYIINKSQSAIESFSQNQFNQKNVEFGNEERNSNESMILRKERHYYEMSNHYSFEQEWGRNPSNFTDPFYQSSIHTRYQNESLSMQNSIVDILRFHKKFPKNVAKMAQIRLSSRLRHEGNRGLISQTTEIKLNKKKSAGSASTISEKGMEINIGRREELDNTNIFNIPWQKLFHTTTKIRVVFIYLSAQEVGKMDLKMNQTEGKQATVSLDVKFSKKKYKNICINYATFELPDTKRKVTLWMYQNMINKIRHENTKKLDVQLDEQMIYNGHYLLFRADQTLVYLQKQLVDEATQFSILSCVKFVMKTLVQQLKYPEQIIFTYLKLFYDYCSSFDNIDILKNVIKQLYISKSVPFQQSKYLTYLFYAIFRENSLGFYFNCDLYTKIKFQKAYVFSPPKQKYSHLIILEEFYNALHLLNLLFNYPKEIALIVNCVCLSLKSQRHQNAYLILHIVSYFASSEAILALNSQFRSEFYSNPFLSAIEYYNVRIVYLTNNMNYFEEKYQQNVNMIMTFLDDLIELCKRKPMNKKRKLQDICNCQIQKIFFAVSRKYAPQNWIKLISKVKELKNVSGDHINLIHYINIRYNYFLDRNLSVDYLKVLLRQKINGFDQKQAKRIFLDTGIDQNRIKTLILQMFRQNIENYSKSLLLALLNEYFINSFQMRQEEVQIMISALDEFAMTIKIKRQEHFSFLERIFSKYLFQAIIVTKYENGATVRYKRDLSFYQNFLKNLKRQQFKVIVMEKILNIYKAREEGINLKSIFFELYPENTQRDRRKRRELEILYQKYFVFPEKVIKPSSRHVSMRLAPTIEEDLEQT